MAVAWKYGAWGGLVVLAACTALNPAFEDDGGSSGPASSAADAPGTSSAGGSTTVDSDTVTATNGASETSTSSEPTAGEETGPEELPPPPTVGPYGPPEPLSINDPYFDDDDPTLTEDQLELFFASYRNDGEGNDDIWVARRETKNHDWDAPMPVTELNTVARENTPEVSLDGRTMFFSSTRDGPVEENVFMSTRADRESTWSEPTPVSEINTVVRDVCPFVLPNGRDMFLCTGPGVTLDLVHFERDQPAGEWSGPLPLMELSGSTLDCGAWVDANAQVVLFFSDRAGDSQTDLWIASRPTVDEPFGDPEPLEDLNSVWFDDDPWMTQDGNVVYFASDRGGAPAQDLYVAYRM